MTNNSVSSPIKQKIGTVFIPVRNVHKAKDWYCEMLGIPANGEIQFGHLYVLDMGGVGLILDEMPMWGGNDEGGAPNFRTPAFMFQTDDIWKAYQYMKDIGAELVTDIQDDHWFAFKDPDGNLLMMCQ
ncbi:Catechol 2,3-dioxygenase [Oceanobacillus limi]|uniref:Catechol 2,3-dioxygenase n=1 Tax=Oceanobacillus limi TaxID=930131 RepID=A0A1I0FAG6_9BACI|nr:VOC family protein [Oceanobacillus limi]SET54925.1 Catechol 2,3-dioxygenase [Oceanobacillus limi]